MALYLGDKLISSNLAGGDTNPIGSVITFAGSNAPVGYLVCDGSAVSREIYADLFAIIGTTYGEGDGSTTFNLPDFNEEYKKLLWTNPNPSATFAGQTIPLNLDKYSRSQICYAFSTTYPNHEQIVDVSIGRTTNIFTVSADANTRLGVRNVAINTNNIVFAEAYYNGTARNEYIVPTKIYGIKETTPVIKASHSVTIQGVDTMSEAEYQDLLERLV